MDPTVGPSRPTAAQRGLVCERQVGRCSQRRPLQLHPHPLKGRRSSLGVPPAGTGMEKPLLVGQGYERVNCCCWELLVYCPVCYINKEHLETTAPIYPYLLHPLFQKKKKKISVFTTVCFSSFFNLGNCLVNSQEYIFCLKKKKAEK